MYIYGFQNTCINILSVSLAFVLYIEETNENEGDMSMFWTKSSKTRVCLHSHTLTILRSSADGRWKKQASARNIYVLPSTVFGSITLMYTANIKYGVCGVSILHVYVHLRTGNWHISPCAQRPANFCTNRLPIFWAQTKYCSNIIRIVLYLVHVLHIHT